MKMRWLAVFSLLIYSGCMGQKRPDKSNVLVSIDLPSSLLHSGEEVYMECRISNIPDMYSAYIYWFKAVMSADVEFTETIAYSTHPMPPYDRFTRFTFDEASSGTSKIYTLKIKNVTAADNGQYGCSYGEMSDGQYEMELLQVYANVDYITIMADHQEVTNEKGIMTEENRPTYMEITVGDAIPTPVVTLYAAGLDITEEFSRASNTQVFCSEAGFGRNCPIHQLRSTTLSGNYTFNGMLDEAMLMVVTSVPGSVYDLVNRSVPMTIEHGPLFNCNTEQFARRGSNYTLSCDTHSRPTADVFYWKLTLGGETTYVMPDTYVKGWNVYASVTEQDGQVAVVSLQLFGVNDVHYTTYELVVGNDYDNNTVVLTLKEDSPAGSSSASHTPSSPIVTVAATVMTLWMRYRDK